MKLIHDLMAFLEKSPTSYHATDEIACRLTSIKAEELVESEDWVLKNNHSYFMRRGGTVIAFKVPKKLPKRVIIAASHSDSPTLKIKPHAEFREHTMNLLRTESYGGPQLSTWFDRDLALAGVVFSEGKDNQLSRHLLYAKEHPFMIPSLAIHLQEKKEGKPLQYIDKQDHLCPLLGLSSQPQKSLDKIISHYIPHKHLVAYDLFLIPTQAPSLLGMDQEFLASYRLDNLSSAHACLTAFIDSHHENDSMPICVIWNHEEIGSETSEGASSPLLYDALKRIIYSMGGKEEDLLKLKSSSLCLSVDVGHAYHPNFSKRYDPQDHPLFGQGILIKYHGHLKYATTAESAAKFAHLCLKHKLPHQMTSYHSEISGGSTVGPIMSGNLGIPTLDIGPALLGMHSTRELMNTSDHKTLYNALKLSFEEL